MHVSIVSGGHQVFFHSLKIYKFVYVNPSAVRVFCSNTALNGTELLILHDCDVCKIANV